MNRQEEIKKGILLYGCCVLVFTGIVMLGSQLNVASWLIDLLIFPAVAVLYYFSDSPAVLKWFELFPHFGSRGLPLLYAVFLFSPLIGLAMIKKKFWMWLQWTLVVLHLALFVWFR